MEGEGLGAGLGADKEVEDREGEGLEEGMVGAGKEAVETAAETGVGG